MHGREGAAKMTDAVNPTVGNFESHENTAGAQDAEDFREHLVLEFAGFQVVQDKDGKDRGEGLRGKGQLRSVAADSTSEMRVVMEFKFERGPVVVLEGGHAGNPCLQERGRGAVARADLEQVIAEAGAGENPGEKLAAGEVAPQGRRTDEVFGGVHKFRGWEEP